MGGITIHFISNVRPEKLAAARSRALPLLEGQTIAFDVRFAGSPCAPLDSLLRPGR
jgi:hypothetical protein